MARPYAVDHTPDFYLILALLTYLLIKYCYLYGVEIAICDFMPR